MTHSRKCHKAGKKARTRRVLKASRQSRHRLCTQLARLLSQHLRRKAVRP